MGLFEQKSKSLTSVIPLRPGYFGKVSNTWVLPIQQIQKGDTLHLETLPATCMFRIYKVMREAQHVGYGFASAFNTVNGGGYLLTRTEKFVRPDTFTVLLRLKDVVVYAFPNCGALAISPRVSQAVKTIFEEQ